MRRRRSPVRESGNGFLIELGEDEATLVARLLDEMRQLLTNPSPDSSEQLLIGAPLPGRPPRRRGGRGRVPAADARRVGGVEVGSDHPGRDAC